MKYFAYPSSLGSAHRVSHNKAPLEQIELRALLKVLAVVLWQWGLTPNQISNLEPWPLTHHLKHWKTVDSIAATQLQNAWFGPDLRLLSVWTFACSLHVQSKSYTSCFTSRFGTRNQGYQKLEAHMNAFPWLQASTIARLFHECSISCYISTATSILQCW